MSKCSIDLFDGHCDTILQRYLLGGSLCKNDGHIDLERADKYHRYAQFFALFGAAEDFPNRNFTPTRLWTVFQEEYAVFQREMQANEERITFCRNRAEADQAFASGKAAAFLSVEGAELLDCSLERLEQAHAMGVRAVNLTWNHVNDLSGTNVEEPERGLTAQGRAFVHKMEKLGMLIDVSHLSDPGFWDVSELLDGPFFSSHSNSRALCSNSRNLTDAQFTAIIEHDGVAGLNLYADFLGENPDIDTVVAHLEHFLELGGERNVALGGDLDGCDILPTGIAGIQDLDRLWERLQQRNYSESLLRALFFENLMRVVSKVCTM
ncbi:dipeptidase [Flavonifractor hominis]|uniref:Dipeptidase n=1 Tax=Flavonifractor hominis TaxID=3133178 RepID=A0ABV1EKT9_9FIRM